MAFLNAYEAQKKKNATTGVVPDFAKMGAGLANAMSGKQMTPVAASTTNAGVIPSNIASAVKATKGLVGVANPVPATQTTSGGYVPPMNAANNTTGQAPALGYGAGGEYGKTQGLGQAYKDNAAYIATDAGKQSEIARTQAVIAARQAAGEDVSLQEKYLKNQLGYVPPMQTQQVQATPVESAPAGFPMLTQDQIKQEVDYGLAKERSDLQTTADKMTGSVKNNFDYATQILRDNRTISDASRTQSVNPFAQMGKRTRDEDLLQRQRGIDDTYMVANMNNELNAIQSDLYNFDKLAPDKQRALINEMTRIERDYGIAVGTLTGQIPGMGAAGQTMQSKAFDRGIFESDREFATTLDRIKRADYESDRDYEFARTQTEWDNMFKTKQFDEGKAARLWEQAFQEKDFAQAIKDEAAARGLQWASLNQRDKEFIADQAFRNEQFKYQKDQDLLKGREQPATELNVKDSTNNYNSLLDDLDDPAITKEEARMLLQQNSKFLTDSDYKKFNDEINSRF